MILGIIIASLTATALFRLAQSYYFPLHARDGLQPILFAVASVAIGFLIGWAEGVIFFIVYFFGGIVIGELTKEKQTDERACLEKEIENHLKKSKMGKTFQIGALVVTAIFQIFFIAQNVVNRTPLKPNLIFPTKVFAKVVSLRPNGTVL